MRTLAAVTVLLLCACDQGAIEKPKPAAAAPAQKTEVWRLPDAPFSANAWRFVKPGLTMRGND